VTLEQALQTFAEPNLAAGISFHPRCCGLPVVMNSQRGWPRIYCIHCGRAIILTDTGWVVQE